MEFSVFKYCWVFFFNFFIEGLTSTELFHPYEKLLPVRNNNKSQITWHLFTLLISFSAHTLQ